MEEVVKALLHWSGQRWFISDCWCWKFITILLCIHLFCFAWHEHIAKNAITCNFEKSNKEYCKQLSLHTTKKSTRSTSSLRQSQESTLCPADWPQSWALHSRWYRFSSLEFTHPHRAELRKAAMLMRAVSFGRQSGNISWIHKNHIFLELLWVMCYVFLPLEAQVDSLEIIQKCICYQDASWPLVNVLSISWALYKAFPNRLLFVQHPFLLLLATTFQLGFEESPTPWKQSPPQLLCRVPLGLWSYLTQHLPRKCFYAQVSLAPQNCDRYIVSWLKGTPSLLRNPQQQGYYEALSLRRNSKCFYKG